MATPTTKIQPAQTTDNNVDDSSQMDLFPQYKFHVVSNEETARQPIKLPRSVLTIKPDELLCNYLSRVANTAMEAATKSYGSSALAATRLGTRAADPQHTEPRTKLKLAKSEQ